MQASVQWVKDVSFVAESGSGHAVVLLMVLLNTVAVILVRDQWSYY